MVANDEKIVIGKILRPHGVRGYARVLPETDNPSRFKVLKKVWLRNDGGALRSFDVEHAKILQKFVLLKLSGIETIEQVDEIRNQVVVINRSDCLPLDSDEYYFFVFIGARVVTTSGDTVGIVRDVLRYPASEILAVEKDQQEILIPAVAQFIKQVDIESSTITIEPIAGLLP